jgi:pimeloyl-ACP methyl ester carboxylesterase
LHLNTFQVKNMFPRFNILTALSEAFALLVAFSMMTYAQTDGAPPFGYPIDSVSFQNEGIQLAGAFLKPEGNGQFPGVVIIHGAGHATLGEPAFRVHANAFVQGGFAVLLYDKRGSGRSTGDLDTSDFDDLAADLAAGVQYLRTRTDIISSKIGVLGRSEGGWVGALAASRDSLLAFVILSSGSGVRPSEQVIFSTKTALRAMGASQQDVEAAMAAKSAQWEFYRKVTKMGPAGGIPAAMQAERDSLVRRLRSFARFAPQVPQNVRDPVRTPYAFFEAFTNKIDYDPLPSFRTADAALFAVVGANDEVVDPVSTEALFEQLHKEGRNVTVRILPDVGHSLLIMTNEGWRYPEDYPEFVVRWARTQIDQEKK